MDLREMPVGAFRRHPWETARARFFSTLVLREVVSRTLAGGACRPLHLLDVGAGDGYLATVVLAALPAGSQCVCVDPNYTDEHLTALGDGRAPGIRFARNHPDGQRDLIMLLDVLEHVGDDLGLLSELAARLAPGGCVLVSVPAFMSLYCRHDARLGHLRRYRRREVSDLVERAGLSVLHEGGLFHSLLPVRAAQKGLEALRGVRAGPDDVAACAEHGLAAPQAYCSDLSSWHHGPWLTGAIEAALGVDAAVSLLTARAGVSLPGLSYWALGQKVGAAG